MYIDTNGHNMIKTKYNNIVYKNNYNFFILCSIMVVDINFKLQNI